MFGGQCDDGKISRLMATTPAIPLLVSRCIQSTVHSTAQLPYDGLWFCRSRHLFYSSLNFWWQQSSDSFTYTHTHTVCACLFWLERADTHNTISIWGVKFAQTCRSTVRWYDVLWLSILVCLRLENQKIDKIFPFHCTRVYSYYCFVIACRPLSSTSRTYESCGAIPVRCHDVAIYAIQSPTTSLFRSILDWKL